MTVQARLVANTPHSSDCMVYGDNTQAWEIRKKSRDNLYQNTISLSLSPLTWAAQHAVSQSSGQDEGKDRNQDLHQEGTQLSDSAWSPLFPGQRSLCTLQHFKSLSKPGQVWELIAVSLNSHRMHLVISEDFASQS